MYMSLRTKLMNQGLPESGEESGEFKLHDGWFILLCIYEVVAVLVDMAARYKLAVHIDRVF
jgi:hypothetical protein